MVQEIDLPDGSVGEFPDEMSGDQIAQVLQKQFPSNTGPRPPRGEGQSSQISNTSAGLVPSEEVAPTTEDPERLIPTEIDGVVLSDELREAIRAGRDIKDPKEKSKLAARIAGRIASQSEDGNLADQLLNSQFGAGLRGFANGIFGAGDVAAAATTAITGEMTFGDSLELQREFRRGLEEEFPITSGISELTGILVGAGGAGLAGRTVAKQLPGQLGKKATSFISLQAGQGGRNVGRAALAGATAGGVAEGVMEGAPGAGAALGAAGGPLGLAAVKTFQVGKGAIQKLLQSPDARGIIALAKQLGEKPQEMARRFLEFKQVQGRNPAIADIANPQAVAELRETILLSPDAVRIAQEGAETATRRRAADVAEGVTGGRVTTTQTGQKAARDRRAIDQFKEAEDDAIEFTSKEADEFFGNDLLMSALPRSLRPRIQAALEAAGEGNPVTLSGLDVNDLRLALRDRARGAVGSDRVFGELADEVELIARGQSPAFARAIDEFSSRSLRGEGVAAGRKVSSQDASEFEATFREGGSNEVQAGTRVGARSELSDRAARSAGSATGLARELAQDSGLVRKLREVMPAEEVDRLQQLGRQQSRSAANMDTLSPAARSEQGKAMRELTNDVVGAMVVAGGNTGGAFKASILGKFLQRVMKGQSKKSINNLARDAFDPNKTEAVIAALRKGGLSETQIVEAYGAALGAREGADIASPDTAVGTR